MWLITGTSGFIGSSLVHKLNSQGVTDLVLVDVVAPEMRRPLIEQKKFTRFVPRDELGNFLSHKGGDQESLKGVVHLGACSSTTETDVDFLKKNNTDYTIALFQFCRQRQIPFVFASSGAVYGSGELGFDDGIDPSRLKPLNPYGRSKLAVDVWANANRPELNFPWYGLRFFNVYGPNELYKDAMASLVFKAFGQIRDTGRLKLFKSGRRDYEDGKQLRDFIYVKDITDFIWQLMQNPSTPSGIYNMGFGQARTWLDLAAAVFSAMRVPLEIEWIEMPPSVASQYQYVTQAPMKRWLDLGLGGPRWTLEEGVRDCVANYMEKGLCL